MSARSAGWRKLNEQRAFGCDSAQDEQFENGFINGGVDSLHLAPFIFIVLLFLCV